MDPYDWLLKIISSRRRKLYVNSESKKDRGSDKLKSPKTNVKPKQTHVILIKGIRKES